MDRISVGPRSFRSTKAPNSATMSATAGHSSSLRGNCMPSSRSRWWRIFSARRPK